MSALMKVRLLAMLDNEIREVTGSISNNKLWMHGSGTKEEATMFEENIADLEEYKSVLLKMCRQVEEGTFNV